MSKEHQVKGNPKTFYINLYYEVLKITQCVVRTELV